MTYTCSVCGRQFGAGTTVGDAKKHQYSHLGIDAKLIYKNRNRLFYMKYS